MSEPIFSTTGFSLRLTNSQWWPWSNFSEICKTQRITTTK